MTASDPDGCLGCLGKVEALFWNVVAILVFGGLIAFGITAYEMDPKWFDRFLSNTCGVLTCITVPVLIIAFFVARKVQNPDNYGGEVIHGILYKDWREQ